MFLFGWLLSLFIFFSVKINHITMYFVGCKDGSDAFYFRTTLIFNIIIFICSLSIIRRNKPNSKKKNIFLYIGFVHIAILLFLFKELYYYLLFSTIKGISLCTVSDYGVNLIINPSIPYLPYLSNWQEHFSFIDRFYALLPILFSCYFIFLTIKMILESRSTKYALNC